VSELLHDTRYLLALWGQQVEGDEEALYLVNEALGFLTSPIRSWSDLERETEAYAQGLIGIWHPGQTVGDRRGQLLRWVFDQANDPRWSTIGLEDLRDWLEDQAQHAGISWTSFFEVLVKKIDEVLKRRKISQ
jgi:hypothetical protein